LFGTGRHRRMAPEGHLAPERALLEADVAGGTWPSPLCSRHASRCRASALPHRDDRIQERPAPGRRGGIGVSIGASLHQRDLGLLIGLLGVQQRQVCSRSEFQLMVRHSQALLCRCSARLAACTRPHRIKCIRLGNIEGGGTAADICALVGLARRRRRLRGSAYRLRTASD